MEHAPLRPVPSRPAGPIDPAIATREVAAALPELSELEVRALALVALAERPRPEVAATLGVDEGELRTLLARARKELRRTVAVLGGSGWCERAESLISDRLDGALAETDTRRLDAHLRNCPRCVEHERRLVQATDWLLTGLAGPAPTAPPPATEPPSPLGEAPPQTPPGEAPPQTPPGEGPPVEPPPVEPPPGEAPPVEEPPVRAPPGEPPPVDAPPAEPPPVETPPTETPPADAPPAPEPPPGEAPPGEAPATADSPAPAEIAAAAEVLVAVRTRRQVAAALTWNALIAIAILLTLAAIALTVAGITGAEL